MYRFDWNDSSNSQKDLGPQRSKYLGERKRVREKGSVALTPPDRYALCDLAYSNYSFLSRS